MTMVGNCAKVYSSKYTISVALGYLVVSNMKLSNPVDQPESISTAPTWRMEGIVL